MRRQAATRTGAARLVFPEYPAARQLPCTAHPEVSEHHHRLSNPKDNWQGGEGEVVGKYGRPEATKA